jgi:manganese/zinc/iron transport system permease protein
MNRAAPRIAVGCLLLYFLGAGVVGPIALAQPQGQGDRQSLADRSVQWPSWQEWRRLILLEQYNTRVVIIGVTLLGCAAGMVGSFTLLRKRALMGDALSHATLPGIGLVFMLATVLGFDGKSLPLLLLGATVTGLAGLGAILVIRNATRLKEDTALGAVLSVFFGAGIALLGVVQQMKQGSAAGLESFIYGKTASMTVRDTQLIAAAALTCIGVCVLLFKEFKLLCFDEAFAGSRGFPTIRLDVVLMALVVTVCIIGLQAVGLILVIALLIIPAAAARFWTESMWKMFVISGTIGAVGGMVGAGASALFSRLPSGAMIVLICTALFMASMVLGTARGLLVRWLRRARLNRTVDRQHLLRAMYELLESSLGAEPTAAGVAPRSAGISVNDLLEKRSWTAPRLLRAIRRAVRYRLVVYLGDKVRLTDRGKVEAARLTRQHRLWELYLITHAEIAPSRVDREADAIEHVLEPEVVAELETLLDEKYPAVPRSPHAIGGGTQRPIASSASEGA